ncbi:PAS domain-containing protein [Hymenobacter fodinae]|uniref:histidine kinase n=1 Tax=Hymenobacter fodinae TaxID=2510796 RepID=A0A4Z0P398_9BACT|nr:PAS domain-containing protein [Hymenobacter fodinae]TGE05385.1 PAS domain S-box protein [Hymenobacter fodinae]
MPEQPVADTSSPDPTQPGTPSKVVQGLHRSDEQFRLLVMASSDMVYKMSADWSQMHQLVGKELLASTTTSTSTWLHAYLPVEEQAPTMAIIQEAIRTKNIFEHEHRVIRADGSVGWVYSRAVPVLDAQGQILEWLGTAKDITSRKQAEQELLLLKDEIAQRAQDNYRALFNVIDEGFCVLELQFDAAGNAVDWIYREANPAFELQTGFRNPVGQRISHLQPDLERSWFEQFAHVARTGEPTRFMQETPAMNRWYDVYAFRVGNTTTPLVSLLFTDVTARKRHEQQQAFLLQLSDTLRPLSDPLEIQYQAACVLGQYLGASRVGYAEDQGDQAHIVVTRNYTQPGVPSIEGRYHYDDYGPELLRAFRQGQTVVRPDIAHDSTLSDVEKQAHADLQLGATVNVPLRKDGQLLAVLFMHYSTAHAWTDQELTLLAETAERTWGSVVRARTEAALRDSEARFRNLVVAHAYAVWETQPNGQLVQDSPSWRAYTGQTLEEWLGYGWLDAIHPEDREYAGRQWQEAVAVEGTVNAEFRVRSVSGGYRWTNVRATPIRDAQGRISKWMGMNIDIHQQKSTEEALRQSEKRLRIALEAAKLGTWDWDIPTNEIRWNARHYQQFGLEPTSTALTSADFARHLHPTDRDAVLTRLQAAVDANGLFEAEFRILTEQGTVRWMSSHGQATDTGPDGRALRMNGVLLDITESKQAEQQQLELAASLERKVQRRTQALQQSRDLLQSVYDTSLIGMAVLRANRNASGSIEDFTFVSVNRKLQEETGLADLIGQRFTTLFPGPEFSSLLALMCRAVETGQPQQTEYYHPYADIRQWYSSMYVQLDDGVVVTTLNITERKLAEEERLRQFTLLQQAESVAELGSWEYEPGAGTLRWSAGMYRLFGLPEGSPVAPTIYLDYVVPDDRAVAERLVHCLTKEPRDLEETLQLRVGKLVKTIRVKAVVLAAAPDQAAGLLGVDLDISTVHQLEQDNLRMRLEQQQALFNVVLEAQESERKRIGEALHNGVGQILYATKLQLDQARTQVPEAAWARAYDLLADAIRQTRAISHELVPLVLTEFGLEVAMQDICRTLSTAQLTIECHLSLEELTQPLPQQLQVALFRMAQELAQNIIKHARATEASLALEVVPGYVLLRAEDNGVGFPAQEATSMGLGLRGIRDRVALLGGAVHTGSSPQVGTYVRIRIPLFTSSAT